MIGIYKITSPSNRIYIGQSTDVEKRIKHYSYMKCKKQVRLYTSFLKYGVENHTFEILQECEISELNDTERKWQEFYNVTSESGLNCDLVTNSNSSGKRSEKTKIKIGAAAVGNKNFSGKRHSKKAIELMKSYKKKPMSEETKLLIRNANLGKKYNAEAKSNMSKNSGMAKTVLNLESGIFHYSVKEVSETYGVRQNTLIQKLGGHRTNNTKFTYI